MAINKLSDGTFTLPTALLITLITILSTLTNFDEELSHISESVRESQERNSNGPEATDDEDEDPESPGSRVNMKKVVYIDDEFFREKLKEALTRLSQEEEEEYESLKREFPEVEEAISFLGPSREAFQSMLFAPIQFEC